MAEDELLWETRLDITPKYIRDDLVLLLGLTETDAEQIMNGEKEGGTSVFYSMERWSLSLHTGCRLTWVQCWGIPLQAWNMKYIHQIVAVMGEMVDMDDEVEEKWRFDRARVLIKTPWRPTIQHTIDVVVDGETFKVHVIEECGGGYRDCLKRGRNFRGSSEEIDSDNNYLGSLSSKS